MIWDIFCNVIDNHGDLGVCWRLSADLAAHGEQVRLWVDDASALSWMAPGALQGQVPGIRVLPWSTPLPAAALAGLPVADVWIEGFGCEIAPEFLAHFCAPPYAETRPPVWLNLEYLSAEPYVERSHRLPSPVMSGPARGQTKWFFYPGFMPSTGGLLREEDLPARQAAFDRAAWLARQGLDASAGTRQVSLFCYEPPALGALLTLLAQDAPPTRLLVTSGRATQAVRALETARIEGKNSVQPPLHAHEKLSISYLPFLPQPEFDHLLWACDLNFVRGEDSLVRALWAGAPLVWQIYPQDDNAHHDKLEAFLDWLRAPPSLRDFHRVWNGVASGALPALDLPLWRACVQDARRRLLAQDDLTCQLLRLVMEKR